MEASRKKKPSPPPKPEPVAVKTDYRAVKGDLIDEMLAQYIVDCPVPVKRLGDGYYMFGTRKIYAKILNGKLVIRVGGGYMVIAEFIATYGQQEYAKMQNRAARGEDCTFDDVTSPKQA